VQHSQRRRRVLGGIAAALFLGWGVGALALDAYGQRAAPSTGRWDAIVVAGCRVMPDGRPSPALARRVARAVELWKAGRAPLLVMTGGMGEHPPTEAEAAAQRAHALGVPWSALVRESQSTTTAENARFAAAVTDARRVLVVSDTYHVLRCEWLFGRHFAEARGVGSTPEPWPRVRFALREVGAVLVEAARAATRP